MKEKIDGFSVVVTGAWNPAIFTPAWVANGRLTESDTVQMGLMFGSGITLPEFIFDEVVLRIEPLRLYLGVTNSRDETLRRLTRVVKKILEDLPHTPIQGLGVNFGFVEDEPLPSLLEIFNLRDNNSISDLGWRVENTQIKRQLILDGVTLNHTVLLNGNQVTFDLNFHTEASSCAQAIQKLKSADVLKTDALTFLNKTYSLNPQEA